MNAIVISDLHIGSKHFRCEQFLKFVRTLPDDSVLVLNGDTVNYRHKDLPKEHREALNLLRRESFNRRVVWVRGNHDKRYLLKDPGRIEFKPSYTIGNRLFITHGHNFDFPLTFKKLFIASFFSIYYLHIRLGGEPVHVAFYAKKFPQLYNIFRAQICKNAVQYAKQNGYQAVTCGHTHYVEDTVVDGVRYINTGSWTEEPLFCLWIDDEEIRLREIG